MSMVLLFLVSSPVTSQILSLKGFFVRFTINDLLIPDLHVALLDLVVNDGALEVIPMLLVRPDSLVNYDPRGEALIVVHVL